VILLDTSVLSRVFRRRARGALEQSLAAAVERLLSAEASLGIPGIVLQELLSGVRSAKQFDGLRRDLVASFAIVLATEEHHLEAARLRNKCLAQGLGASLIDCLIATMAIVGDHELFAADRDFEAIALHCPLKLLRN
jgi:predicted nucleic acid-binding protein